MDAQDCNGEAVDLSNRGLRIASIFIILVAALLGALSPVLLARQGKVYIPRSAFFVCKFVGSGVIIATAWMHLLVPAVENLSDPCLEPRLGEYPWAFAIGLMTLMVMFFVELLATSIGRDKDTAVNEADAFDLELDPSLDILTAKGKAGHEHGGIHTHLNEECANDPELGATRGADTHRHHDASEEQSTQTASIEKRPEPHLAGQLTAIFILEFGVVFHSVFIGLTLGTTDEVKVLLIVLTFHQLFEGLGLGSRLALTRWPANRKWLPFVLGAGYAISTPVGIAAGIGAQPNNANTQKLVNGIFDAISAGILMYTGLVELLAHEFMFNPHMRAAPLKVQLTAFSCVALGVAIMALLAKWA